MPTKSLPAMLMAATSLIAVTACSAGAADGESTSAATAQSGDTVSITVSTYPLEFIATRIGGQAAQVNNIAPAGTEPHDLELAPADIAVLGGSDVVVTLARFQPAVDDALTQIEGPTVLDAAAFADLIEPAADAEHSEEEYSEDDGHDHGDLDPHFWLDPMRVANVADALAETLSDIDPSNAGAYTDNAAQLRADLEDLDARFREGLTGCASDDFVTSHEAFGYLAHAYQLHQIGISGIDPESEPSPARVADVLQQARDAEATTVFAQPGGLTAGADVIADELGLTLATLDPIELQPADSDYLGAMTANLAALREGLACP
ncbi:MAG: metal ABC transporter substrate-binding protein [Beutenbergiaceae bacterium]